MDAWLQRPGSTGRREEWFLAYPDGSRASPAADRAARNAERLLAWRRTRSAISCVLCPTPEILDRPSSLRSVETNLQPRGRLGVEAFLWQPQVAQRFQQAARQVLQAAEQLQRRLPQLGRQLLQQTAPLT